MSKAVKLELSSDQFVLPPAIMSQADVSRALRELERIDYIMDSEAIREPGKPIVIPTMSRGLADCITLSKVDVTNSGNRKQLVMTLRKSKEKSPVVHVTFAVEPVPAVTAQIVMWIRTNLHSSALVTVGLQPRIVGGCIVRTPGHVYDFSIRKRFKDSESVFINSLGLRKAVQA